MKLNYLLALVIVVVLSVIGLQVLSPSPRSKPDLKNEAPAVVAVDSKIDPAARVPSTPTTSLVPKASPPYLPVAISNKDRLALPILDRLLTPRSDEDQEWMLKVGYPKLADIDGPVADEQLLKLASDYENSGPDPYAANVLATRLYRRNDPAWREIVEQHAEISPFLARFELELELAEIGPGRSTPARLNDLAIRASLLGDREVGFVHSRSFDRVPWNVLSMRVGELEVVNKMLTRYGRQTLPVAIRPIRPDGP